jgi:hypothetical protein
LQPSAGGMRRGSRRGDGAVMGHMGSLGMPFLIATPPRNTTRTTVITVFQKYIVLKIAHLTHKGIKYSF